MRVNLSLHAVSIDAIDKNEVYIDAGRHVSIGLVGPGDGDVTHICFDRISDLEDFGHHLVFAADAARRAPKDNAAHFCWIEVPDPIV